MLDSQSIGGPSDEAATAIVVLISLSILGFAVVFIVEAIKTRRATALLAAVLAYSPAQHTHTRTAFVCTRVHASTCLCIHTPALANTVANAGTTPFEYAGAH